MAERTKKSLTNRKQIVASILLYSLPIIFFIISYFLITTSGEDIWQGANNFRTGLIINPIDDAINAFNYNSRITDMYAWSIIDFFDYQFQFGPDIIFRFIDVLMASATFYLATYIILRRKPKLLIKDSLIFCAFFAFYIITPFGRPFYHEFSMIHNYLPLAFSTLLFSIPYINFIRKNPPRKHLISLAIAMLFIGVYFGMAATITPLAFLATVIIYCIVNRKTLTRPPVWVITGIFGVIAGFTTCWLAGSGVDHYTNPATAAAFDYISLSDIFTSPTTVIPQILWHEIYNFALVFLPLILTAIIGIFFSQNRKQFFTVKFYKSLTDSTKKILLTFSIFTIIHILGASLIKSPPRLLIPAYLAGLISIFYILTPHIKSNFLAISIVIFTTLIIAAHTFFLAEYHIRTAKILDDIQQCNCIEVCINPDQVKPLRIPLADLSQANIIVDWESPQQIYRRNVTFCK